MIAKAKLSTRITNIRAVKDKGLPVGPDDMPEPDDTEERIAMEEAEADDNKTETIAEALERANQRQAQRAEALERANQRQAQRQELLYFEAHKFDEDVKAKEDPYNKGWVEEWYGKLQNIKYHAVEDPIDEDEEEEHDRPQRMVKSRWSSHPFSHPEPRKPHIVTQTPADAKIMIDGVEYSKRTFEYMVEAPLEAFLENLKIETYLDETEIAEGPTGAGSDNSPEKVGLP